MAAVHLPATPAAKAAAPTAARTTSALTANPRIVMANSCPRIIPAVLAVAWPDPEGIPAATPASLPAFFKECRYEYRHGRRDAYATESACGAIRPTSRHRISPPSGRRSLGR